MRLEIDDVDDLGTTQEQAREELKDLCEFWFDGNADAAAIALGRDEKEISALMVGSGTIDDDLILKVRGIKQQRNPAGSETS